MIATEPAMSNAGYGRDTRRLAARIRDVLSKRFAAQFEVHTSDGRAWRRVASPETAFGDDDEADDLVHELLTRSNDESRALVQETARGGSLVSLPVPQSHAIPMCAAGIVSCNSPDLLGRLAETTLITFEQECKLAKCGEQLDEFSQQVATDFEELAWLRELVNYITLCDATQAAEKIAREMVPSLRELIGAEDVVYVRAGRGDDSGENRVVREEGQSDLNDDNYRALVDGFADAVSLQPVVRNHLDERPIFQDFSIRSCILVEVGTSGRRFGWLIAINKTSDTRTPTPEPRAPEFGTFDVGPLEAAALILATHSGNVELVIERDRLLVGVIRAMVNTLDAKDSYTCGHSERVAQISRFLAGKIGLAREACERIYMTGLLHDIGKIGVPDDVLGKNGPLNEEEFEQIRQHPVIGHRILSHVQKLDYVLPGVLHHHEDFNGSGYPDGLAGSEIPLDARVLAVADSYDAMTSDRPYRKGMSFETAESILRKEAGEQFDADIVAAMLDSLTAVRGICSRAKQDPLAEVPDADSDSGETVSAAVPACAPEMCP